jgi:tetratricopeptide (TPR) repeat protein
VALNNIGLAYYRLSHYQEALRYYHQALSIARGVKGRENEAITLNNIGRSLREAKPP